MSADAPRHSADSALERADELRMSFGEHLEELRSRLIRALLGGVVALGVTFYFGFHLIAWLAQPFLQAMYALGFTPQTIETDPTVGFTTVYLPVALISAAILASPWIIYQIWQFVVAGLYAHERRTVYLLAPFSTIMTVLGVLFAYHVLLPVSLLFFLNFATLYPRVELREPGPVMRLFLEAYGVEDRPALTPDPAPQGDNLTDDTDIARADDEPVIPTFPVVSRDPTEFTEGMVWINRNDGTLKAVVAGRVRVLAAGANRLITPMPRLREYIRFAAMLMLGVVIAFQVPVVMLVMGWTQLFDPYQIGRYRKYALFAAAILGAVLTPTDIFSMIVLTVPLYILFELGLLLMRLTYRVPDDV